MENEIMELITVHQEKCTKCGICVKECPSFVLKMGDQGPEAVSPDSCIACGHCTAVCPNAALDNHKSILDQQRTIKEFPVLDSETAELFLRSRRSIRTYKQKTVPREELLKLVEVARLAPTGSNSQGVSYIIVEDKETVKKAVEITIEWLEGSPEWAKALSLFVREYRERGVDSILRGAPHLILATTDKDFRQGRENSILSLAYLELFVPSLGLGSCWAGIFELCACSGYEPMAKLFKIPDCKKITGAVMVGYPQYRYQRLPERNPLEVTFI
jgi:nitroreductase/ferredoxin